MHSNDLVSIGLISTTHGYKGIMKAQILSSYPERFQQLSRVIVDSAKGLQEYAVESCVIHGSGLLIKLAGIDSKEEAALLRQARLCVHEDDIFPLPDDEYYHFQLIGLKVYDEQLGYLGQLSEVIETGANDVYAVQSDRYKEILIPALKQVVLSIDIEQQRMDVRLLDGLIGDDQ